MGAEQPTVLVTGATGFVGHHLVRALLDAGYAVRATGRRADVGASLAALGAEFVPADLTDPGVCGPLLDGMQYVVHTAARTEPWGTVAQFEAANATTTRNLLLAARRHPIRRVVHFSSPSVQSRAADQLNLREGDRPPGRFLSPYAASKWSSEQLVAAYIEDGCDAVVLRPKAVYGPGDTTIMPKVLDALRSGKLVRFGPRPVLTNFTNVRDVVAATLLALDAPVGGTTFTIAHSEPIDVWQVLDSLSARLGYAPVRRRLPRTVATALAEVVERAWGVLAPRREPPVTRYAMSLLAYSQTYDTTAAAERLGFEAQVRFADGLEEVVASAAASYHMPPPATEVSLTALNTGHVPTHRWLLAESGAGAVSLPSLVALVEHPTRGWGLVDTGYSPRFFEATSRFPYSLYRRFTPAQAPAERSVTAQLAARGLDPDAIRWVVLTHLDPDHCCGLAELPHAQVYASAEALAATSGSSGVLGLLRHRQLPGLLPERFFTDVQPVKLVDGPWGPFTQTADMFGDSSLILVGLPGHVRGHVGVAMRDTVLGRVLWCGDAYWTRGALEPRSRTGAHLWLAHRRRVQRKTYRLLGRLRAADPLLVMVGSHDPQSARELGAEP